MLKRLRSLREILRKSNVLGVGTPEKNRMQESQLLEVVL